VAGGTRDGFCGCACNRRPPPRARSLKASTFAVIVIVPTFAMLWPVATVHRRAAGDPADLHDRRLGMLVFVAARRNAGGAFRLTS
jgi:hypothetical protein